MVSTQQLSPQQIEQFIEQGYFLSDTLWTPREMSLMSDEFQRIWDEELESERQEDPKAAELTKLRPFIAQVHRRSSLCERFCHSPIFLDICRTFIGPDAHLYYNQAVLKPPGRGRSFGWHQDTQYTITHRQDYVTCWVAVTRATVENGTIWVVPGMHRQGLLPHHWTTEQNEWHLDFDDSGKVPIEMEAGRMAVFSSLLPHCSGPNVSDEVRMAYVVQYHEPCVREVGSGRLVGDQVPVLSQGQPVTSSMAAGGHT